MIWGNTPDSELSFHPVMWYCGEAILYEAWSWHSPVTWRVSEMLFLLSLVEDWVCLYLKVFCGLLPYISLLLQKGTEKELLKISSDLRSTHHSKLWMTQWSDQEPGRCTLMGFQLTKLSVPSSLGGVFAFWARRWHLTEFYQGQK